MANDKDRSDQQSSNDYAIGELSANISWLINSINNTNEKIDRETEWKSSISEKFGQLSICAKDLKANEKELALWKNETDSRIKFLESWKAQHSEIEKWKSDKELRMAILEKWMASQSGAQNLVKTFLGAGVIAAILTLIATYLISSAKPPGS